MEATTDLSAVPMTAEGYLLDMDDWTPELAHALAATHGIALTDDHLAVLTYLREQQAEGTKLTIRRVGKSGLCSIKEFYGLFPGGPLKVSSRIAGIPKPASCI